MRRGDNEFFVDLENGAISLDERFKEVTGSKKPRAPYFEKTMQLASGVKVVVSGSVDPKDKTINRNLRVAVSRNGGLSQEDVSESTRMILDMGLKVTAVSTKKPGSLRDTLNDHLLKYTASQLKELLVENQKLIQQVADWEKKHSGYLKIPLVKAGLMVEGGFYAKLDELKNGPKDTASLRKQNRQLRALVRLLPENPREVKELMGIPQKMQSSAGTFTAVPLTETAEEKQKKEERQIKNLHNDNEDYLKTIKARVLEMDRFISKLDQLGQGKRVGDDIRKLVMELKSTVDEYSNENKSHDISSLTVLNLDLRAISIVLPEVLPKDAQGKVKENISEREIKQGLKGIKEFPKKIVRFVEENTKSHGSSKMRAPSWSGVKEKLREKLPGLAGALAKLSIKQESDMSQGAKKGPDDPGARGSSTFKK